MLGTRLALKAAKGLGAYALDHPIQTAVGVGSAALAAPHITNSVKNGVQQYRADAGPYMARPETFMPKMSEAEKYVQKLAAAGYLDDAAVRRVREKVQAEMQKHAQGAGWAAQFASNHPTIVNKVLPAMGTAALAAAMPIMTDIASQGYDAVRRAMTKGRDFRAMMEVNPELKKIDAATVQKHFNVLHRFSPELAKDPTVAAAWIKQTAQFDEVNMNSVRDLIGTRKSIMDGRPQVKLDWQGAKAIQEAMGPSEAERELERMRVQGSGEGLRYQHAMAKARAEGERAGKPINLIEEEQTAAARARGAQSMDNPARQRAMAAAQAHGKLEGEEQFHGGLSAAQRQTRLDRDESEAFHKGRGSMLGQRSGHEATPLSDEELRYHHGVALAQQGGKNRASINPLNALQTAVAQQIGQRMAADDIFSEDAASASGYQPVDMQMYRKIIGRTYR